MTVRYVYVLLAMAIPAVMASSCSSDSAKPATGTGGAGGAGGEAGSTGGATGTTAGTGNTGGKNSGGATGTTADAAPEKCIKDANALLADFKTDNSLSPVDGRQGGFYVYGDGSIKGVFDPALDSTKPYPIDTANGNPDCSGPGSFHTNASGWGVWGAALGTDFEPKDASGFKGSYDASKYKGISFWAKGAAPIKNVQVSIKDIYTDGDASFAGTPAAADAGITQCVYAPDPASNCSPYLVKFGDATYPAYQNSQIDTTWKRFDVLFADTMQDQYNPGFHTAANKLDTKHLTGFAIQVNADFSTSPPTPNDFEIWVDDVNFIP